MIVIDPSACLAIALQTDEGVALRELLQNGEELCAPAQLPSELAMALQTYVESGTLSAACAEGLAKLACQLSDGYESAAPLAQPALAAAAAYGCSVPGAFYLVLAKQHDAALLTLDSALAAACDKAGVRHVTFVEA